MNSHKRLTGYLSGPPPLRAHSQENYLTRATVSLTSRIGPTSPRLQSISNAAMPYRNECINHSHHCCCHSQPHLYYQSTPENSLKEEVNVLKEDVKRERFENKLLLKELQTIDLLKGRNQELNLKLEERIDEISKMSKVVQEHRREIEILKDANEWLKQESLRLSQKIQDADKQMASKDKQIGELEAGQQGDYLGFQKKLAQMQREVQEYKQQLHELRATHKVGEEWKRESMTKMQGKMRSQNEISLCIDGEDHYPLSRGTQTYMSGADIDYGASNVSRVQDELCQKINQNIIAEDTLFRRIRGLEQELARGMDMLVAVERRENQLQMETMRMESVKMENVRRT